MLGSRTVDLDRLTPGKRERLEGELADVFLASFVGPSRSQVVERFVRRGPTRRTTLLLGADDAILGFASSTIRRVRAAGRDHAVLEGGLYLRPGTRGGGERGLRAFAAHGVRHLLRHPRIPICAIGPTLTPLAYRRLMLSVPGVLPRPGVSAPAEIDELMRVVVASIDWAPVADDPWVVARSGLDVRPRGLERLERSVGSYDDPHTRYYIERNPGYGQGHAMMTYCPYGWTSVALAAVEAIRKRPR